MNVKGVASAKKGAYEVMHNQKLQMGCLVDELGE